MLLKLQLSASLGSIRSFWKNLPLAFVANGLQVSYTSYQDLSHLLHKTPMLASPVTLQMTICLKLTDIKDKFLEACNLRNWGAQVFVKVVYNPVMNCHVGAAAQITNHSWPLWPLCTITRVHNKQAARVRCVTSPQSSQNYWAVLKIENTRHMLSNNG